MDFDFEHFLNVENAISAIFNGFPVLPPAEESPASSTLQGSQGQLTTSETRSTPPSASLSKSTSLPKSSSKGVFTVTVPPMAAPTTASPPQSVPKMSSSSYKPPSKSSPPIKSSLSTPSPPESTSPLPPALARRVGSEPSRSPPSGGEFETSDEVRAKTEPIAEPDPLEPINIPPNLDMTSAIALSQKLINRAKQGKRSHELAFGSDDSFGYGPRRFMTVDEASQLPPKPLRDELVKLYFECFHPFCPVVDEYDFMRIYDKAENDEKLKMNVDLPLFQAMMFVAFGHMPATRLKTTSYKSIHEGQRAYFDKASLLYRMNFTPDQLILTKVALLLTYWSPFDAEYKVNSYWVDRAFNHARAIKLWDPKAETTHGRRRIVWWCCLMRDRMISFALRRNYRIQEAKSNWPLVEVSDFGLEVMFPRFVDVKTKRAVIDAFIWLCKLSDIIRDVAIFHENNSFGREWSDSRIERADIVPEINQVTQFDSRLKQWREGYLRVNGDFIKSLVPRCPRMPNYVLFVNDSTITTLYLPYIHCPPGSIAVVQRFQKFALNRIKAASSMVALHIRKLNATANVGEEIMVGIIAWIALPMAVFKVLSEIDGGASLEPSAGRFADFIPFLSALAERFNAAKVLYDMMSETTGEIVDRSLKFGITRKEGQIRVPGNSPLSDADSDRQRDVEEAEVLNVVAKMLDLRLSTDGSK